MTINAPAHLVQTWNKLYFNRLGFRPKGKPSLEQLNQLILAHQLKIPFENVDIQLGNQLDLSLPVLRKKILLDKRGGFGLVASRSDLEKESKEFRTVYTFSTEAKVIEDFFSMFNYHQSSEQCHFVEKLLISVRTENGRKSISKNKLIITEKGSKQLITLKNAHDFQEVLSIHFGILISENQAVLLSSAKR